MNKKRLDQASRLCLWADAHTKTVLTQISELYGITKSQAMRVAILYAGATMKYYDSYVSKKAPRYMNSDAKIKRIVEIVKTKWVEE